MFQHPHLAFWDEKTIVVVLDKGGGKEFGFSYKVKVGKVSSAQFKVKYLRSNIQCSDKVFTCTFL